MAVNLNTGKSRSANAGYFYVEAATVASEDAAAAYQSPSLLAMGASARNVTMFSLLGDLMTAVLYLRIPSLMERSGSMKRSVFPLALVNAITWIPLILVMLVTDSALPSIMMVLCAINLMPGRLMIPARDSWIASLVPAEVLGSHVGLRTAITTITYLIVFFSMGQMLDVFGTHAATGFGVAFSMAFIAALLSISTYSRIQDHPKMPY